MYCKYKFVTTGNEEFFSTVNKEFLNEIKFPSQLNKHNLANVTYIDFIVNTVQRTPFAGLAVSGVRSHAHTPMHAKFCLAARSSRA